MVDALYERDGDLFVPSAMTAGPWSSDAQHGGPVAALLARAAESVGSAVAVDVVRLSVELMRPVPLSPLSVTASLARPGRKVQLVDASISADDVEVARARALRIRVEHMDIAEPEPSPPTPPPPDGVAPSGIEPRAAFTGAVDLRFVRGSWEETGPCTLWVKLLAPVVADEDPSPLQRTAAATDFGNGVSRVVDFDDYTFPNVDLTVALARMPLGEWIGLDVISRLSPSGYGQAESQIFDRSGPVGRAVQSLILERR